MSAILDHILHKAIEEYCCCNAKLPNFDAYEYCDIHDVVDFIRNKYKKAMSCDCGVDEFYKESSE